jgi:RNA binding exosome subunit
MIFSCLKLKLMRMVLRNMYAMSTERYEKVFSLYRQMCDEFGSLQQQFSSQKIELGRAKQLNAKDAIQIRILKETVQEFRDRHTKQAEELEECVRERRQLTD